MEDSEHTAGSRWHEIVQPVLPLLLLLLIFMAAAYAVASVAALLKYKPMAVQVCCTH
jgi:hypothetical protein